MLGSTIPSYKRLPDDQELALNLTSNDSNHLLKPSADSAIRTTPKSDRHTGARQTLREKEHGTAHHQTPADVLSFIGHTLGFWPHESLVCITLDANRVGATLRVDLPRRGGEVTYARTVADYLAHDTSAASVLFAVYTSEPQEPGRLNPTRQPSQH